jgi:hypothetical protein
MEATGIVRAELCDCMLHAFQVRGSQQFPTRAEDQAVLGIEPIHGDFFIKVSARGSKDLAQHFGIKKEGRTSIEFESVSLHGGSAATDNIAALDDGDVDTRPCEQNSSSQSTWTGPDNDDFLVWLAH